VIASFVLDLIRSSCGESERVDPLQLETNSTFTIFSRDRGTPDHLNIYGAHPFYLQVRVSSIVPFCSPLTFDPV
jgi:hypothetical protein